MNRAFLKTVLCTLFFAIITPGTIVLADPATDQALDTLWTKFNKSSLPAGVVSAVECVVQSEDEVMRSASQNHAAVLQRINALFSQYPENYSGIDIWDTWQNSAPASPFFGGPPAHTSLLMLRDIATTGSGATPARSIPVVMTVVICDQVTGTRPTKLDGSSTETVTINIHQGIIENDYKVLRQALRLFQRYVWGITRGELRLDVRFVRVPASIGFSFAAPNLLQLDNYTEPIQRQPSEILNNTDMWWVIYPDDRPVDTALASMSFVGGGGMGGYGSSPVFLCEDSWPLKNRFSGGGISREITYTEIERRCYLPQWFQHEFFHYLYQRFPEFGFENASHQWFDMRTWVPYGFVGKYETHYFSQSYHKYLDTANPSIAQRLRVAPKWSLELPGNHAPIANAQSVIVRQNTPLAITLKGSDPDNDSLTFVVINPPSKVKLTGLAPNVTCTPATNYLGNDSFTFRIVDSKGVNSPKATVSITVAPNVKTIAPEVAGTTIQLQNTENTLRYFLPAKSFVRISYFDIKGRLVASLVGQEQGPGNHTVAVPVSRFSKGVFVCVFHAGSFKNVERFTVN